MAQVSKLNYVDSKLGAPSSGQQTTRVLFNTIEAPVVPIKLAKTAPLKRIITLFFKLSDTLNCTWIPPATTKSANNIARNAMYSWINMWLKLCTAWLAPSACTITINVQIPIATRMGFSKACQIFGSKNGHNASPNINAIYGNASGNEYIKYSPIVWRSRRDSNSWPQD